jgi:hypothetical protein
MKESSFIRRPSSKIRIMPSRWVSKRRKKPRGKKKLWHTSILNWPKSTDLRVTNCLKEVSS